MGILGWSSGRRVKSDECGLVSYKGEKKYFTAIRQRRGNAKGGKWEVTLVSGETIHVDDKAIVRPISEPAEKLKRDQPTETKQPELSAPSVSWLKDCEICNAGLCKEMNYLTDSVDNGGLGLPVREAAKRLEEQGKKQIGEAVWTAEQIRARYLYHTGQMVPGRNSTTTKKVPPPEEITRHSDPGAEEVIDRKLASDGTEAPVSAGHRAPLCETDKEAFLQLIERMRREWAEAIGLEKEDMNTGWSPYKYLIFPASDQGKEIRSPTIIVTEKQFKELMKKYPEPIEIRIFKALSNFQADLGLPMDVPVPDEVYEKLRDLEEKKSRKEGGDKLTIH